MTWLIRRLKEPSTWRGLTILLVMMGFELTPEQKEAIAIAGVSMIGLIEVLRKEKEPPPHQIPEMQSAWPPPWAKDQQSN